MSVKEKSSSAKRLSAPKTNVVRPLPKPAAPELPALAEEAARRGTEFLFSVQRDDARWCAELESNTTITAEYVFLAQILGLDLSDRRERIIRHLLGMQSPDGSWGIARHWDGDVSTTAEVYLALRILGLEPTAPGLIAAEKYIR